MRWGYANKLGPFELWDALGVEATVRRMEQEQRPVPANVDRMLASGAKSFYQATEEARRPRTRYYDLRRERISDAGGTARHSRAGADEEGARRRQIEPGGFAYRCRRRRGLP